VLAHFFYDVVLFGLFATGASIRSACKPR
jgi:hypothetical protein